MTRFSLYVGNDSFIEVSNLQNSLTHEFVNDAVLTAELSEKDTGDLIATVALDYIAASNGKYRGILPADTELIEGEAYMLHLVAEADYRADWRQRVTAFARPAP